jgi:hypothetical protein
VAQRRELVSWLVDAVGPAATLVDAGGGWPAIVDLALDSGHTARVAVHLSNVGPMNRRGGERLEDRPRELRFQNPANSQPPSAPSGTIPLLIGVLRSIGGDPPALVLADKVRFGGSRRFSVRFPGSVAYEGAIAGYATHATRDGEEFVAISPPALPALVLAKQCGVTLASAQAQVAIQGAGPLGAVDPGTKERARAAATRLVRSATFRRDVLAAWSDECAFCDLAMGPLLEAAHLYPASLPGSSDVVGNGVPACLHHHALLDMHHLHIDPLTLAVSVHPSLSTAIVDPVIKALVSVTRQTITLPATVSGADVSGWLERRYAAYPESYDWVSSRRPAARGLTRTSPS